MLSSVLQHATTLGLSVCLCAVIQNLDYVFAENGLVAYKDGRLLCVQVRVLLDFQVFSSDPSQPKKNQIKSFSVLQLLSSTGWSNALIKVAQRQQHLFTSVCLLSPFRDTWEKNSFKI